MHDQAEKSVIADSDERLVVDSWDESSDTVDVSSSEYSPFSDSEGEEENLACQKISGDGGENTKSAKRNAKTSQPPKKIKVSNTALNSKEMEHVAAWIFSSEEAKKVEQGQLPDRSQSFCRTFVVRHRGARVPTLSDGILSQIFYLGIGILTKLTGSILFGSLDETVD